MLLKKTICQVIKVIIGINKKIGLSLLYRLPKELRSFDVITNYHDVKIKVFTGETIGSRIYFTADYEHDQLEVFLSLVKANGLIFDVGANYGLYSLLSAKRGCRVCSFEPSPQVSPYLIANIELNNFSKLITYINEAVSNKNSRESFYIYSNKNYGVGRVFDDHEDSNVKSITINANTIDYYAEKFGAPDLIKMDIEGAEALALLGGDKLFSQSNAPILFIEFHPGEMERLGGSLSTSIEKLQSFGYRMWVIDNEKTSRHAWNIFSKNDLFVKGYKEKVL